MKKKIIALITALTLAVSLSACGKDTSSNNSDADKRIAELEQELEELRAENKDLKAQLGDASSTEQQSSNEAESLLKTTIESPETSGVCGAGLTWYYQNGVLAITSTGEMARFVRETDRKDLSHSWVTSPWWNLKDKIVWVIIDDGVTTIGECAFEYCFSLSKVVLPNTLTTINEEAFAACYSLKEITIPDSVTDITNSAFDKHYVETIIYKDKNYTFDEFEDNANELGISGFSGVAGETVPVTE